MNEDPVGYAIQNVDRMGSPRLFLALIDVMGGLVWLRFLTEFGCLGSPCRISVIGFEVLSLLHAG